MKTKLILNLNTQKEEDREFLKAFASNELERIRCLIHEFTYQTLRNWIKYGLSESISEKQKEGAEIMLALISDAWNDLLQEYEIEE